MRSASSDTPDRTSASAIVAPVERGGERAPRGSPSAYAARITVGSGVRMKRARPVTGGDDHERPRPRGRGAASPRLATIAGWRRSGRIVRKIVLASQNADRGDHRRVVGSSVVGSRMTTDGEAGPAQDRDERAEVAEGADRPLVEARAEPGPSHRPRRPGASVRRRPWFAAARGPGSSGRARPVVEPRAGGRLARTVLPVGAGRVRASRRVLDRAVGGLDGRNRGGEVDRGRAAHGTWCDPHRRGCDRAARWSSPASPRWPRSSSGSGRTCSPPTAPSTGRRSRPRPSPPSRTARTSRRSRTRRSAPSSSGR